MDGSFPSHLSSIFSSRYSERPVPVRYGTGTLWYGTVQYGTGTLWYGTVQYGTGTLWYVPGCKNYLNSKSFSSFCLRYRCPDFLCLLQHWLCASTRNRFCRSRPPPSQRNWGNISSPSDTSFQPTASASHRWRILASYIWLLSCSCRIQASYLWHQLLSAHLCRY
jgi:hypothetical protein